MVVAFDNIGARAPEAGWALTDQADDGDNRGDGERPARGPEERWDRQRGHGAGRGAEHAGLHSAPRAAQTSSTAPKQQLAGIQAEALDRAIKAGVFRPDASAVIREAVDALLARRGK